MVLPPKPPPISLAMTRMSPSSMPSAMAVMLRTPKWPWVLHQTVAWPSSLKLPTQAWGSM